VRSAANGWRVVPALAYAASLETQEFYGEEYVAASKGALANRLKLGRDPQFTVDCMMYVRSCGVAFAQLVDY